MSQVTASKKVSDPGATAKPPPHIGPGATVGHELHHSPAVKAAIDAIIAEARAKSAQLTGVRPPNPALKQSYDDLMKRAADARGRALLYPYLGSGIGNGALVELADGSVKWDMICGIGVHFFGHSDPDLMAAALRGSLDDTLKAGNLQSNFDAYAFCETLLAEARKSTALKHAYVSTSGAMANEQALKVCYQKHAPASRVLAFRDCFMGRSTTMSQIGDTAAYRIGLPLWVPVDYMPFWDPVGAEKMGGKQAFIDAAVRQLREYLGRYPRQHACFIFELIQGEGGFNVGDRDFFKALMDICRENSIAVWADEIQTFGRLPAMFAADYFGLGEYVDVMTIGKMTQSCVTLFTEACNPGPGLLSGTFLGEGVSFRVGQRVVERLKGGNLYGAHGAAARHHAAFVAQVQALAGKHPEWFPRVPGIPSIHGGLGGMMRFTPFGGDKDKAVRACKTIFEEGVILFYCGHGPYHLRVLPPLPVFQEKDWPEVFACIERGLARAASE
ncbi:MAG: aminotransferase class III-fold pyridoxal phosphate-dependent enzyme [Phycisphaerales bacterium]